MSKTEETVTSAAEEFNPFEAVDITTTIDGEPQFGAELLDVQDTKKAAAIHEEIVKSFGNVDVNSFEEFKVQAQSVTSGEYSFAVEAKFLKEAIGLNKLASASTPTFAGCKLTLSKSRVQIDTFNSVNFAKCIIPTAAETQGLPSDDAQISFVFLTATLAKLAENFPDAVLQCVYKPQFQLLSVVSGNTNLELPTSDINTFQDYSSKIGEPKLISQVNPEVIHSALQYQKNFIARDIQQKIFSVVEVHDGMCVGGSPISLGIYKAPGLGDLTFKITVQSLPIIEKALPRLNPSGTYLFETDQYLILRDSANYVGFSKENQYSFPPVKAFLNGTGATQVYLSRLALYNELSKLSIVSTESQIPVKLVFEGSGNEATVKLYTTGRNNHVSSGMVQAQRRALQETFDYTSETLDVSLQKLQQICGHFSTPNVCLEVFGAQASNNGLLEGKALIIRDDGPNGEFNSISFLNKVSSQQLQQMSNQKAAQSDANKAK